MGRAARIQREPEPHELTEERAEQLGKCFNSYVYFVHNYCRIYDSVNQDWIRFRLWPAQEQVLHDINSHQLVVILKARQLGITWLSLAYGLWTLLFRPIAAISVFSRRENEALYMLSNERLRGMYNHLPEWMKTGNDTLVGSGHEWILRNGSSARAFPTSAGDGYVSTLAIVDEADLSPDLNKLMRAVKPTIDNGGKLVLLSRVDKLQPMSEFKAIYRGARKGENGWHPVFLPWNSHPGRTQEWYERQRKDALSRTGSLDELYEQYPESDAQALASATLSKRIPPMWLEACFEELAPLRVKDAPAIPGLKIYRPVKPGVRYCMGADPAEGNPDSDDSSCTVIEVESGEEVAALGEKVEPAVFAFHVAQLSRYYNHAPLLVERNNHGHSVIQWMEQNARRVRLLLGHESEPHKQDSRAKNKRKLIKPGWLTTKLGKSIMYNTETEFFRVNSGYADEELGESKKVLHSFITFTQLSSIELSTLAAPQGMHDDYATSHALAVLAREQLKSRGHSAPMKVTKAKGWGL